MEKGAEQSVNKARNAIKTLTATTPAGANVNKTPSADVNADVNADINELLLLKRDRAVVSLMRDEEALFDEENFERRVEPPGRRARARIAFGLTEILEPDEAASLLAYLDRRDWKFRFSLATRDLRQTYKPRWFFRFLLFKAMWLVISLPFIPGNFTLLIFSNRDWMLIHIFLITCGAASVITTLIYYEFEERCRVRRVNRRERLMRSAPNGSEYDFAPHRWTMDGEPAIKKKLPGE